MVKDFDTWNTIKKKVDEKKIEKSLFFLPREIWWCSLGQNIGVESDGKHADFERPVLILKVFNAEMIWILPVTSTVKQSPYLYYFKSGNNDRSIMLSQIRTVSTKRLKRKIETLNEADFNRILKLTQAFFKSETPTNVGESRRPKPLIE